ncbi:hypothetical protein ACX0HA_13365 [Flavobacterium hauense]
MIDFSKPKHLFLIGLGYITFLSILLGLTGVFPESYFVFGVNKTIGQAYDFVAASGVFFLGSQIIAVTGYGFLWLFKCRINLRISIVHYFIIILIPFVVNFEERYDYYGLTVGTSILTIVIAVMNAVFAMYYKLYDKNKRLDN